MSNSVPILMDINGTMGFDNGIQAVGGGLQLTGALTVNGGESFSSQNNPSYPNLTKRYMLVNQEKYQKWTDWFSTSNAGGYSLGASIVAANGRIISLEFDAISSIQVKDVLDRSDKVTKEAIALIKAISIVKYNYKDKVRYGNGKYYGVIAEELREVMPELVGDNPNIFVPNIMQLAKIKDYPSTKKDTSRILSIIFKEPLDKKQILIDKKIQLYCKKGQVIGTVLSNNDQYMTINLDQEILISELPKEVFVYGTAENCPSVSKGHFNELATIVIQDLLKRIEVLENKLGDK